MSNTTSIDDMASAINRGLQEYSTLATTEMKSAVQKAAKSVKDGIQSGAPVNTGKYRSSWSTKKTKETSESLEMTVYSRNRYSLAHLLEKGHAKRGGGRVAARPHIAPAAEAGEKELEQLIETALRG